MAIRRAVARIKGVSPYSQSKHVEAERGAKELPKDFELRTWRDRLHVDSKGEVFIPPMAFKNCIAECAKYLSMPVKGKGKATYTKHFEAGVMVVSPVPLGIKRDATESEWLFVPSDGRRGGGSRVMKCFPIIRSWGGDVEFIVADETIGEDIFKTHLEQAGQFIGIGRFRPRNNGYYGRFEVQSIKWA